MAPPSTPSQILSTGYDPSRIELEDGTPTTPKTLLCKFTKHDFALTDLTADGREEVVIENRGQLVSIREGGLIWPKLAFSGLVADLHETSVGTPWSWLHKLTPFSARLSTFTTHSTRDHSHVIFTVVRGATERVVRCENVLFGPRSFQEANEGNSWTFNGVVYGNVTVDGEPIFTAPVAA